MKKREARALGGTVLVSALVVCGCPPGSPTYPEAVSLMGTVYDNSVDPVVPVANARVVLLGTTFEATTNAQGYYSIPNLPAGWYQFQVSASGYTTLTLGYDIPEDTTLEGVLLFGLNHYILRAPL